MRGEQVEDLFTITLAAASLDAMAKHDLLPVVMNPRLESEDAGLHRVLNRSPGEGGRNRGDVFLRIAAVYTQGVQLHQLTTVVLVQATRHPAGWIVNAIWTTGKLAARPS